MQNNMTNKVFTIILVNTHIFTLPQMFEIIPNVTVIYFSIKTCSMVVMTFVLVMTKCVGNDKQFLETI